MPAYLKDPSAVLDFGFDWQLWLASGETISASTWTITEDETSPSTTLFKASDTHNTTATTAWLSGGTPGVDYVLTNHITTSAGRQDDRSMTIKVLNR